MMLERWMFGAVAAISVACTATTQRGVNVGKPVVTFPSSAEVEKVTAQPAEPAPPLQTVEVERWEMQGPIPPPRAEYVIGSPWDELLKQMVAERAGQLVLSSELACAARETARFYLQHGACPSDALQRHLVARCGSTLAASRVAVFGGATPDDIPDEQVQRKLGEKFPDFLKQQLPPGAGSVGLSFARGNGRAAIVFYAGEERARLDGFSPVVNGPRAVLEGELPAEAAFGLALINQGRSGVSVCEADPRVQLPRFRFSCPMLEADTHARIDIAMRRAGQILPNPLAAVLVRRSEEAGLVYEPALPGDLKANVDEVAFQAGVLARLNELRRSGGVPELTLEIEQSKTNAKAAPRWFDATFRGQDDTLDLLALGLIAGWQVEGTIRQGAIHSGYLATSRSPERWLSDAIASPLGRSVFMDPLATRVAIGAGALGPSGIFAIATSYSFFDSKSHEADEAAVFEELARVRQAKGLPAPRKTRKSAALEAALEKIRTNVEDPDSASNAALKEVNKAEQRTVSGWVLQTNDLKQLKWPPKLLQPGPLDVSVGVTHYKAPTGAWGQYAILIVMPHTGGPESKTTIESAPPPQ